MFFHKIRKLSEAERQSTRRLWETIFIEDSKAFVDYYYARKMPGNTTYAAFDESSGELVSMLHLTPYDIGLGKAAARNQKKLKSYYIVGVATQETYRHQGYMQAMLKQSLSDCRQESIPFVFLMPASAAIYEPYDFRYICERRNYCVDERKPVLANKQWRQAAAGEYDMLAKYCNNLLQEQQDYFCLRSADYYKLMSEELASQDGKVLCLKDFRGIIQGEILCAREVQEYLQEILCKPDDIPDGITETKRKPIIMARIADVKTFLECFFLKEDKQEKQLRFKVEDSFLTENSGTYQWTVSKEKSVVHKSTDEMRTTKETETIPCFQIAELTELFFGRKECRQIPGGEIFAPIYIWKKGCINEIV